MFSLANVTVGQVSKILHSMSSSKATGLDEIPAKYIKDGSSVIGSFHVKSSGDFHGPPPILLKFGTLVGIV